MASFKAKFPVLQELFAKNHRGPFGSPPPSGARVKKFRTKDDMYDFRCSLFTLLRQSRPLPSYFPCFSLSHPSDPPLSATAEARLPASTAAQHIPALADPSLSVAAAALPERCLPTMAFITCDPVTDGCYVRAMRGERRRGRGTLVSALGLRYRERSPGNTLILELL